MMNTLTTNSKVPWPKLKAWLAKNLHGALDDFLPQPLQLAHAKAIQQVLEIRRQAVLELGHIGGNVQLAAFNVLVQRRPLLHQQGAGDDHRQNRHHQAQTQGAQRGEVARPAELELQATLQGCKDNPEDHRPEHCTVKRQENPDKRDRHQRQQDEQAFVLQVLLVHIQSMSVNADVQRPER
jgi:hypothetical protein